MKKLPEDKDFKRNAVILSRELVDHVIRPKRIVALGTDPFYMLDRGPIQTKQFGHILFKYGHRGDMLVGLVYNPSQYNVNRYYTDAWIGDWQKALEWFMTEAK